MLYYWNDNLATPEAKMTFNRPSSSVPFYCFCLRGRQSSNASIYFDLRSNIMVYKFITWFSIQSFEKEQIAWENGTKTVYDIYSCFRHLAFTQT